MAWWGEKKMQAYCPKCDGEDVEVTYLKPVTKHLRISIDEFADMSGVYLGSPEPIGLVPEPDSVSGYKYEIVCLGCGYSRNYIAKIIMSY